MEKLERTTIYASLGLRPGISELLWAFRKKYTLEEFPVYLDDHPFQLYERIKAEMKNGMKTADLVLMPHYMLLRLKSEGLLTTHDSRQADAFPKKFYDKSMNWFAAGVTFMSLAYNSKLLQEEDLPATLDDFSSPKWRGSLGLQSLTASRVGNLGAQYLGFIKKVVGDKKWSRFLKSLAHQNRPKAFDCIDHLLQGLVDGEFRLALTVYSLAYFREKTAGSPVASFEIDDAPRMLTFTSAGLIRNAEENASAHKFLEFLLTEDAQKIIASIRGIAPTRPGVLTTYPFEARYSSRDAFHPDESDLEAMPKVMETFRTMKLP
ncbi:MAG: extracellular solute-binding protein [Thaumarchaeota archaeon]|nr:extracellular solute-binding protein [Nitrososphaerota archaeon]